MQEEKVRHIRHPDISFQEREKLANNIYEYLVKEYPESVSRFEAMEPVKGVCIYFQSEDRAKVVAIGKLNPHKILDCIRTSFWRVFSK